MTTKYEEFLSRLDLPTESEFNEIIKQLPPYKELSEGFDYDPYYDYLPGIIFNYGVLGKYNNCGIEDIDVERKEVTISGSNSLEDLEEINNKLKLNGWTLINYEEELEYFNEDEITLSKQDMLNILGEKASVEQLKNILESL